MDLDDLHAIAEKERSSRKPVRIRCCAAASCLSSGSMKIMEGLNAAIEQAGLGDRVQVGQFDEGRRMAEHTVLSVC